jgi:hypothetical protein
MDSLIHNLSLAWGLQLDGQTLRQKLTAIRNLALSHERTSAYSPLLIITDLDLAREDFRMTFFLEAIRHQIVHKEGGSLIFFASTDWTMADAWAEINNFGIICDKCPIT